MTVCVAAIAEESKSIVMIADKAVTYGAISADAGIEKMQGIGDSGWFALMSGNLPDCEAVIRRAVFRLPIERTYESMLSCLEGAYKEVQSEWLEAVALRPLLLTREDLLARPASLQPLADQTIQLANQRLQQLNFDVYLLVCGFEANKPHIFTVVRPGVAQSHDTTGFAAIGNGNEAATARLLWNYADEEDDLDVALYQVVDAKTYAEMVQGVGAASDAWVLSEGQPIAKVPIEIVDLLNDVFQRASRLPFKPRENWYEIEESAEDWEAELKQLLDDFRGSAPERG